ncbi:hypothetical protein HNY73_007749 [Argiope bruennichi]|uniref:Uncharacterized protein n=1 Tax=Argiope bruennichi TaxID=94029 RepID=A0A8T0FJY9_ARGBR|nr:hypothetical protein HNY73_007749 [Argiope bruennichi]
MRLVDTRNQLGAPAPVGRHLRSTMPWSIAKMVYTEVGNGLERGLSVSGAIQQFPSVINPLGNLGRTAVVAPSVGVGMRLKLIQELSGGLVVGY